MLLQGITSISYPESSCCFKAAVPVQFNLFIHSFIHSFIQASILSTVPSLESLLTPWNTDLRDLIVHFLRWYPTVRTRAVFYQGKRQPVLCNSLPCMVFEWVVLIMNLESLQRGTRQPRTTKTKYLQAFTLIRLVWEATGSGT